MTAMPETAQALDPATYGLECPTAIQLTRDLNSIATPALRRARITTAIAQRREDLALMRQLLVERDGTAPTLDRIEARDDVLAELHTLAVMTA